MTKSDIGNNHFNSMTLEEKVAILVSMGFPTNLALDALNKSGNDINTAAEYLATSDGLDDNSINAPPRYSHDTDITPLAGDTNNLCDSPQNRNFQATHTRHEMMYPTTTIPIDNIDNEIKYKLSSNEVRDKNQNDHCIITDFHEHSGNMFHYDIYEDILKTKREPGYPPILLPSKPGLLESYLAPLLMILSLTPRFSNIILKHEFFNYGYKPDWWKKGKCLENSSVTQEIQRLVAFLTGNSERSFASIFNLVSASNKIITEDYDSIGEFIPFVLNKMVDLFGTANYDLKETMENLFKSYVDIMEDGENFREQAYTGFPIESNSFNTNLYKIMHNLLWQKDLSELGEVKFKKMSDILTIIFDSNGDTFTEGFDLDAKFYPQIYTSEYNHLVKEKYDELRKLRQAVSKIGNETLKLRSFHGKSINNLLENSLKYLSTVAEDADSCEAKVKAISFSGDGEKNADSMKDDNSTIEASDADKSTDSIANSLKEITDIKDFISSTNAKNIEALEEFNKKKSEIDPYDIDQILDEETKTNLEPWILVGIIIDEQHFCYLNKENNDWICFNYEIDKSKNYEISTIDFETLKLQIKRQTYESLDNGMIILYVRESIFMSTDYEPMNGRLQEFLDKDNKNLEETYETFLKGNSESNGMIALDSSQDEEEGADDYRSSSDLESELNE